MKSLFFSNNCLSFTSPLRNFGRLEVWTLDHCNILIYCCRFSAGLRIFVLLHEKKFLLRSYRVLLVVTSMSLRSLQVSDWFILQFFHFLCRLYCVLLSGMLNEEMDREIVALKARLRAVKRMKICKPCVVVQMQNKMLKI